MTLLDIEFSITPDCTSKSSNCFSNFSIKAETYIVKITYKYLFKYFDICKTSIIFQQSIETAEEYCTFSKFIDFNAASIDFTTPDIEPVTLKNKIGKLPIKASF